MAELIDFLRPFFPLLIFLLVALASRKNRAPAKPQGGAPAAPPPPIPRPGAGAPPTPTARPRSLRELLEEELGFDPAPEPRPTARQETARPVAEPRASASSFGGPENEFPTLEPVTLEKLEVPTLDVPPLETLEVPPLEAGVGLKATSSREKREGRQRQASERSGKKRKVPDRIQGPGWRRAIIMKEILDTPPGLRDPGDSRY